MISGSTKAVSQLRTYTRTSVFLHWTSAVALLGMLGLGWYMTWIEDQARSAWYFNLHMSLGVLVGLLIVLRWIWQAAHRPRPYPSSMARWQVSAAKASHKLLYLFMVVMPLLGMAGADLSEDGFAVFGHNVPRPFGVHKLVSEQLFSMHSAVVPLHVGAALLHRSVNQDGGFQRMWPSR